jgi:hypothetical protein
MFLYLLYKRKTTNKYNVQFNIIQNKIDLRYLFINSLNCESYYNKMIIAILLYVRSR